jgi:hypothetical protein
MAHRLSTSSPNHRRGRIAVQKQDGRGIFGRPGLDGQMAAAARTGPGVAKQFEGGFDACAAADAAETDEPTHRVPPEGRLVRGRPDCGRWSRAVGKITQVRACQKASRRACPVGINPTARFTDREGTRKPTRPAPARRSCLRVWGAQQARSAGQRGKEAQRWGKAGWGEKLASYAARGPRDKNVSVGQEPSAFQALGRPDAEQR